MRNYYIEFRVYLKDDASIEAINYVADVLQDKLTDYTSDEDAPQIFTQEVTYEVREKK